MRRMRYNIAVVAQGSSGLGPSSDIAGTPGRGSADSHIVLDTRGCAIRQVKQRRAFEDSYAAAQLLRKLLDEAALGKRYTAENLKNL